MGTFKSGNVVMLLGAEQKANPVGSIVNVLVPWNDTDRKGITINHNYLNTTVNKHFVFMDLYIIVDHEPILKGDYYLDRFMDRQEPKFATEDIGFNSFASKIIATTDMLYTKIDGYPKYNDLVISNLDNKIFKWKTDLLLDGATVSKIKMLPKPSQEFINKFVKQYNSDNPINEILIEYEDTVAFDGHTVTGSELKVNTKDNTITIKKLKTSWTKAEVEEIIRMVYTDGYERGNAKLHWSGEIDKAVDKYL